MLISPIMMIPSYRSLSDLQYEYLKYSDQMVVRNGPIVPNNVRIQTRYSFHIISPCKGPGPIPLGSTNAI